MCMLGCGYVPVLQAMQARAFFLSSRGPRRRDCCSCSCLRCGLLERTPANHVTPHASWTISIIFVSAHLPMPLYSSNSRRR